MNFRNLLQSLDQLNEATEKTKTGVKHTSEPGGYGRKFDVGADASDEPKKKRGGQEKDEGPKASKDTPKGDLFGRTTGKAPAGKKGTVHSKMKAGDKAEKAAEKEEKKKSTLKDWFDQLDKEVMNEGGLSVQPIPAPKQQTGQNFMIKDPSNPQAAAITTSDPAVVDAAKKGTLSMHKPGASPTASSATPTTGAGSQVGAMSENEMPGAGSKEALAKQIYDLGMSIHQNDRMYAQDDPVGEAQLAKLKAQFAQQFPGEDPHKLGSTISHNEYQTRQQQNVAQAKQRPAGIMQKAKNALGGMFEDGEGAGNKEALAKQIYDLGMSIHTNDRIYNQDDPEGKAQLAKLKAQFAQQFPGEDAFKLGSAISHNEYQTQQQQKVAQIKQRPAGIMQKAKNALGGMFEEGDVGKHNNATTGFDALVKKLTPKYGVEAAKRIAGSQLKKIKEAERPENFAQASPLSGTARSNVALESKKSKPDANKNGIPDYAEDGKGKNDLKKKKVKEGMEHHLKAAYHEGKSHGLSKMPYNCRHDNMEEARQYHEGYKCGLDECYGQMPIQGYVGEMNNEVENMASYGARTPAMEDDMYEMDKTSYMKQQAAKTSGDTFKAFGQTFNDSDVLDEFAFESLDTQLNALLESDNKVSEGMTVSISKGQQGAPDSVSVSAQDGEADQLLSIIKTAGLGLFGGEDKGGYGAPEGGAGDHGGISVVDDHDGMMALMKKLSGGDEVSSGDYESEEGHSEECDSCGASPCGCDEEMIGEVESEDQMAYEVAEANAPDSGADNTNADVAGQVGSDNALAIADAGQDEEEGQIYSSPVSEESEAEKDDHAERAAKKVTKDIEYDEYHTGKDDDKAERAGSKVKKDIEYDDKMSESSFFNLYKKLAMLSEESTSEKDDKAEKAAKKVAKDIEYDEGHKGKDDDKAERAGSKVKKDIEYDDKKDKKEKKLDEWANEAGKNGTDASFETDIDFMMNVISGGLNKRKSTGQSTIPVLSSQVNRTVSQGTTDINESKMLNESVSDWKKLAGI